MEPNIFKFLSLSRSSLWMTDALLNYFFLSPYFPSLQNVLSPNGKVLHSTSITSFPFKIFFVFLLFVQFFLNIDASWKYMGCFKNTDSLDHPTHPEVIGLECCMSTRIFQSSWVDSNRLRTTGYPFPSSLQCKSSSFSFFFLCQS